MVYNAAARGMIALSLQKKLFAFYFVIILQYISFLAKIWEENSKTFREPVKSEIIHWEEAVMSPFRTIYTRTDLAQDQTPP